MITADQKNQITAFARYLEENEKLSLPLFALKLGQAHRSHPEDYTIGMLNTVVSKMAMKTDKLFISRAEVKDLYEKFYARNNKFAQVFTDELGIVAPIAEPLAAAPIETSFEDSMASALEEVSDTHLTNALTHAFGGEYQGYTEAAGKQAVSACRDAMQMYGFNSVKTAVSCGDKGIIVCSASFETPKGTSTVLVPVQMVEKRASFPSVFVGNQGVSEINKSNLFSYLTSEAGKKLSVRPDEVLAASITAQGGADEISDVDLAVLKMNASENTEIPYSAPSIMGITVEEINPNLILNVPEIKDEAFESLANQFGSELGFASFKFGKETIAAGHRVVRQALSNAGMEIYNLALTSCDDETLNYSVSNNTVAFKVPVKIEGGRAFPPSILICNGSVQALDQETISALSSTSGFDRVASISSSPVYGSKPSELVAAVRSAMAEGNYAKAEDALNVLSECDDEKAYAAGMQAFSAALGNKEKVIIAPSKCSKIMRTAHSQHDICSHTGLPTHKVFQDKAGNCLPNYRQGMADSQEGTAVLISHKVLF